jgi:hypothetical protein
LTILLVYKGKTLHIHRNNKNHILENQNDKHTHCFLIHLNKNIYQKISKTHKSMAQLLKDKGLVSQKTFKTAISSSSSPNGKNIYLFSNFNCKILP